MKRLLDGLASLKLTLWVLVSLCALFLVGLAVPQKQVLSRELYEAWRSGSPAVVALLEALGLTDVYRSPLALGVWALFFANLAVVMVRRAPGALERTRIDGPIPPPSAPGLVGLREIPAAPGASIEDVRAALESRRYRVFADGARLRGVKNRFAPLATLAFHLSFFLVAAGGATSFYTRFEGHVDLGEGEAFTGALEQYVPRPVLPRFGGPPDVRFVVEVIDPKVEQDVPVGIGVLVRDASMVSTRLEVNRPYETANTSFVFKNLGVAPLLLVHDATGAEVFGGWMRLDVLNGKHDELQLLGQKVEAELFPDYFREGDREGTRSQEMRAPALRLTVYAASGNRLRASLRPGESMSIGPYRLTFEDWRWWVRLYVRSERGLGVVWLGFAIASLALFARLVLFRREVVAEWVPEGPALRVAGRAEYYRVLFEDELDDLARVLERELGGGDARVSARRAC